ncbi:SusC/RagA family TonB-linked outer membrane protein [Parabacteroides sp. Marseille-P3160]|uniref:SusC/RagA family TonB-linked outer membrane protein n=1 Tax=Parabacteroides sp. Marseille-P3160 TaxID=1917887 RepID=UPI001F253FBC|nr:SusC/RagA family TonB-linked outer membrane protein [Parabacteroides sp. Marseille-P3160]
MRISVALLSVTLLQAVAAESYSQSTAVSVEANQIKLTEFFSMIEKQSEFLFFYVDADVKDITVNVRAKNKRIDEVLQQALNNTDLTYVIHDRNINILAKTSDLASIQQQQKKRISGTVTDPSGEPIIGANVIEKGTTNGVITDLDGKFSLELPSNAILQVSFVGYLSQEIPTVNRQNFNLVLEEDLRSLDEVVVVGYGTMRKKDVTGAMTSISTEKIDKSTIKSVDQMLQGRSSGLYMTQNSGMPGAGSTIRIRGGNSISGGNEPLYVIDGVPVYSSSSGDQSDLNPLNTIAISDIQSIEILKDASSTAIYGARGANGVVMVTTKTGAIGRTSVTLDASWGVQNIRKKYDLLNAQEFEAFANEAYERAGSQPPFDLSKTPANTDWQELVLNNNALMQNYTLSVSGGDAKTHFLTTLNYMDQDGIIKGSEMEKISLRTNFDREVSSTVKMGLNLSLAQVNMDRVGNDLLGYRTLHPNVAVYDADGNYNSINTFDQSGKFTNPLLVLRDEVNDNERFRTISNIFGEWQIVRGLTLKSTFGVDLQFANQNSYTPMSIPAGESTKGSASIYNSKDYMWVNENTLTYLNAFGKHRINAMIAMTQQSSRNQNSSATSQGFLNDNLQMWDMGSGTVALSPSSGSSRWALLSYLGRINYNFNEKYLTTISFRADGSSRFGRNNRWAYFPSAALAWRASEEEFIKSLGLFSNLKLRVSYGETGNQDGIGVYPSMALLGKKAYSLGDTKYMGYAPTQVANYNLKWETTKQSDFGIEMGFFKNRLNLSVDLYHKVTSDLLLQVQIPSTSGYRTGLKNIGKVQNNGVEFSMNATPIADQFRWDIDYNISFNRNKILDLGGAEQMFPSSLGPKNAGMDQTRLLKVGEPLGIFYGYKTDGCFSTDDDIAHSAQPTAKPGDRKYVDISGPDGVKDNSIGEFDRVILGSAQPDFFGGLTNTFSYRNFDLNVFIVYSYGNDIYNATKSEMENLQSSQNQFRTILNRWTETNQNTNIPRAVNIKPAEVSYDQLVEDGSYLRIQNINLGYKLPASILRPLGIVQAARIYASLNNFFTFTKYSGLDPEVSKYGQNNVALGYDWGGYPMSKSVMFGFNINF